jgi:hypothetical protein
MTTGGDPFAQAVDDPFASPGPTAPADGPPTTYGTPAADISSTQFDEAYSPARWHKKIDYPVGPAASQQLNTYAVLTPIFGVLVPPAGVALGHLALPQIKRTGQRGWLAALYGLILGYALCVVLVVLLIWLLATAGRAGNGTGATAPSAQRPAPRPSPSVVTSVAPPPMRPHTKLDLRQATVGKCVEIEKRDEIGDEDSDEALDLYQVPCQHRVGVYTVAARVSTGAECNSTYVASPIDRTFAVCLNRY